MIKFLLLGLMAMGARAETVQVCLPHEARIAELFSKFGETVQARALNYDGKMMELLANLKTGTWTAVMTDSSGVSCLVSGGAKFNSLAGAPV